ncbi:hypothetical protein [Pseudomonas syringae]|uniref:hypothetical protein n=1 Tax=Pseudomonas syringae TaxID=317 RepID=UPI0011AEDC74|nr:hypothetical protein [Pseudomonas syringae]
MHFSEKTLTAKCHVLVSMAIRAASHWYEKRCGRIAFVASSAAIDASTTFKQEPDRPHHSEKAFLQQQIIHPESTPKKVSLVETTL